MPASAPAAATASARFRISSAPPKPAETTDFLAVSDRSIEALQRSLTVIFDFLTDADNTKSFDYLAKFGHELLLLQVYADEDRVPPGMATLSSSRIRRAPGDRLRL